MLYFTIIAFLRICGVFAHHLPTLDCLHVTDFSMFR